MFIKFSLVIFFRLGKLGIQWDKIPSKTRLSIKKAIMNQLNDVDLIGLSGFMTGTTTINYHWYLKPEIREAVFNRGIQLYGPTTIIDSFGGSLANIIDTLGKVRVKEREFLLTKELIDALVNGITSLAPICSGQNIATIFHGLVFLSFCFCLSNGFHEKKAWKSFNSLV